MVQESPCHADMLDESTDVSVRQMLIVYHRVLLQGRSVVRFGTIDHIAKGDAENIFLVHKEYREERGFDDAKMTGFG